jgi:hypothetical protein
MNNGDNVMHIISLGAGVQSSTMALMAARGEIGPMPVAAIFADTQGEPKAVYEWLDWLEKQLPFPVHRVTRGNLANDSVALKVSKKTGNVYMKGLIPAFTIRPNGAAALFGRRCTSDYKILPIMAKVREIAGVPRGCKTVMAKQWIGISTDEASRMKPSRFPWTESVWPLIDAGMSRQDCLIWMAKHGYPEPPKSACSFCPFHSDEEWQRLKSSDPDEFARVAQIERRIQTAADLMTGTARLQGVPYLHRSGVPIDQVVFRESPAKSQLDLFENECEGMCGV